MITFLLDLKIDKFYRSILLKRDNENVRFTMSNDLLIVKDNSCTHTYIKNKSHLSHQCIAGSIGCVHKRCPKPYLTNEKFYARNFSRIKILALLNKIDIYILEEPLQILKI